MSKIPLQSKFALDSINFSSQSPIQMAGHAEDLLKIKGYIVKRIDPLEAEQYRNFRRIIAEGSGPRPHIPEFIGPFETIDELAANVEGDDRRKVHEKWQDRNPKYKYIILEDVTGGHKASKLRDLKIGTSTASKSEQKRNQGLGVGLAKFKAFRHQVLMDPAVSEKYGFRDEDAQKDGSRGAGSNLTYFKNLIAGISRPVADRLYEDVVKIIQWIEQSPTVYVGSSMLVVVNEEVPDLSRAVMIDFAHPISVELNFKPEKVEKYRSGMLKGFQSILNMISYRLNDFFSHSEFEASLMSEDYDDEVCPLPPPLLSPSLSTVDEDTVLERQPSLNAGPEMTSSGVEPLLARSMSVASVRSIPRARKDTKLLDHVGHVSEAILNHLIKMELLQRSTSRLVEASSEMQEEVSRVENSKSLEPLRGALRDYEKLVWVEDPQSLHVAYRLLLKMERMIYIWSQNYPFTQSSAKDPIFWLMGPLFQFLHLIQKEIDDVLKFILEKNYAFPSLDVHSDPQVQEAWAKVKWLLSHHVMSSDPKVRSRIANYYAHLASFSGGREIINDFTELVTEGEIVVDDPVNEELRGKRVSNRDFMVSDRIKVAGGSPRSGARASSDSSHARKIVIHPPNNMSDTSLMFEGLQEVNYDIEKISGDNEGSGEWEVLGAQVAGSKAKSKSVERAMAPTYILAPGYLRFARALEQSRRMWLFGDAGQSSPRSSVKSKDKAHKNLMRELEMGKVTLTDEVENPLRLEAFLPERINTSSKNATSKGGWFDIGTSDLVQDYEEDLIKLGYRPV
ncbi:inositol polyphosphate kinase family protein [Aureibacter tunicatorum]|nr:inositol polyphosphate kinase family protein [Aureibacter tunicatorum]